MNYFDVVLNDICKGLALPMDIKRFLDNVLDLICIDGFTDVVDSIIVTLRKFNDKVFIYDETKDHVIRELL